MTVGERMKYRRKELKVSAEQVAQQLQVSPATIYRYEKGDIEKVPSHILLKIADVLQISPAWLMGWSASDDSPQQGHLEAFHSPVTKMAEDVLTHEEQHLLASFRNLNADGQSRVLSFIDFCANDLTLLANPPPLASVF